MPSTLCKDFEAGSAEPQFHPELRRSARLLPRFSFGPKSTSVIRALRNLRPIPSPPAPVDVSIRDEYIQGPDGQPLRIRLFSPTSSKNPRPALLWMHGGGFLFGHPEHDQAQSIKLCRQLDMVVAAVSYRLGPNHPYPAPLHDAYAALAWLHAQASALNIDTTGIAVGGASAGACLAAGLTLLAHDRGELPIAFQILIYPNLDDRTALRTDIDERALRICSVETNRFGWLTYLGRQPGTEYIPAYAAPARRNDLSGLPPAWLGVGTLDLFHDEVFSYASRLNEAGVPCTLKLVEGAFHAFDLVAPNANIVADFKQSYFDALLAFTRDVARRQRLPASPSPMERRNAA